MSILDLFSKREKRMARQGQDDIFQYDNLPEALQIQVMHIWDDVLGKWRDYSRSWEPPMRDVPNDLWLMVFNAFAREKATFQLSKNGNGPGEQCRHYLIAASTENAIDLIEFTFQIASKVVGKMDQHERARWGLVHPAHAIAELNGRFREHGVGYEFVGGEIVRVDSKYLHAEATKPALHLLYDAGKGFAGPLQEFMDAHSKYRKGEHKDAIAWALKAFESTLKSICTVRSWTFDSQKDTAVKLLEIVFTRGLVPGYLQTQFTTLRCLMESGVPTVRNKTSGHGQGPIPTNVPEHLARYALNLAATNIVFLMESHKGMS